MFMTTTNDSVRGGLLVYTSYNGESFFVRHAYFTRADQPYERLRKALKAEVDEAWASTLFNGEPGV